MGIRPHLAFPLYATVALLTIVLLVEAAIKGWSWGVLVVLAIVGVASYSVWDGERRRGS